MRIWTIALALAGLWMTGKATTLQKLSVDEMARQSTMIVRAKVVSSSGVLRGQDIYTFYQLQVLEGWKAAGVHELKVAVPGGVANGLRQSVAGAPSLEVGAEYVMFLWTSRSGLTQLIGLSQGLFDVKQNAAGNAVVARPAADEMMLDKSGRVVRDESVLMPLADLRAEIKRVLSGAK
jgi:hypothetical protein